MADGPSTASVAGSVPPWNPLLKTPGGGEVDDMVVRSVEVSMPV